VLDKQRSDDAQHSFGTLLQDGSVPCSYRIAQEGLPLLLPRISRQRLTLSSADFMRLLTERMLLLPASAQPPQPAPAPAAAAASTASPIDDAELSDGGQPDTAAAAVGAANGTAPAADSSAVPDSSAAGGGSAPGEGAAGGKGGAEAAQQAGGGGGQPKSDKPRGPPLDDEATLAQLADIGNGCCVATLRWGRSLACSCYLAQDVVAVHSMTGKWMEPVGYVQAKQRLYPGLAVPCLCTPRPHPMHPGTDI
jgi:hypothetical protein